MFYARSQTVINLLIYFIIAHDMILNHTQSKPVTSLHLSYLAGGILISSDCFLAEKNTCAVQWNNISDLLHVS